MPKIFADHPTKSCFRYDHAPGPSTHLATLTHSTVPTHLPDKTVSRPRTVRYRSLQHITSNPKHGPNRFDPLPSSFSPLLSNAFRVKVKVQQSGTGLQWPRGYSSPVQAWSGPEGTAVRYRPGVAQRVQQSGTGLQWPRGFQEVKVPRFHDNGTGWW
jgi:hypothetical protein